MFYQDKNNAFHELKNATIHDMEIKGNIQPFYLDIDGDMHTDFIYQRDKTSSQKA